MNDDTPANAGTQSYEKRLAALENQVEVLGRAFTAEKKKTEELRKTLDSYESGLARSSENYDRAFVQAAKSYEPIIQRALELSGSLPAGILPGAPPRPVPAKGKPPTFFENMTNIVDDLPKVLASLALIISLITGGTSMASFVKSTSAQIQAATATENAGAAVQEANDAKVEASAAKEKATTAQQNSEVAVNKATEAQVEAATAKEKAESANEAVQQGVNPVVEEGQ